MPSERAVRRALIASATSPSNTAGGPVQSLISADPAETSVTVQWTNDVVCQGWVAWGPTPSYGYVTTAELSFDYSVHAQTWGGLTPDTIYYYQVFSVDQQGRTTVSDGQTFTTDALVTPGHYGPGIAASSKDNLQIGWTFDQQMVVGFIAPFTGSVASIIWPIRWGANYAGGDLGDLKIAIQADSAGEPSGTDICVASLSPGARSGETGGSLKMPFASPGAITAGTKYWVLYRNVAANRTTNFLSVNSLTTMDAALSPQAAIQLLDAHHWKVMHRHFIAGGSSYGAWTTLPTLIGNFDITYVDGRHVGQPYVQAMTTPEYTCKANGSTQRFRERFTVADGDHDITAVHVRIGKAVGTTGTITVALKTSAGSTIDSAAIAATDIQNYVPPPAGQSTPPSDNGDWETITCAATRTLTNGATYDIEVSLSGTGTIYGVTARLQDFAPTGFDDLDWEQMDPTLGFEEGSAQQSNNSGSSWAQPYLYSPCNLQWYADTIT